MSNNNNIKEHINFKDYSVDSPHIDVMTVKDQPVYFGRNNQYPQDVLALIDASPLQSAILRNKLTYMKGIGLEDYDENIYTPNLYEDWNELIIKCLTDFNYLEAFAIQIIMNEQGDRFQFFHQPIETVRLGNYNSQNIIEKAYLSYNWRYSTTDSIKEIKMWGCESPKSGEAYLMYFKKAKSGEHYYAIPSYMSAGNWIMADVALSQYYNNFINNNFSANKAIIYPNEPTEDVKEVIYESLQKAFAGSRNAGTLLLLFGENGEKPEIQDLVSTNADLYNQFSEQVLKYIVAANRLTSPILAGLQTGSGFSSKADEIVASYILYLKTVIYEDRLFVMNKLNYLLSLNGNKKVLRIQDINIVDELEGRVEENIEIEKEAQNINNETEEEREDINEK